MDMCKFVDSLSEIEISDLRLILSKPRTGEEQELRMWESGKHIEAIRARRERTGMGLKECKDSLERIAMLSDRGLADN